MHVSLYIPGQKASNEQEAGCVSQCRTVQPWKCCGHMRGMFRWPKNWTLQHDPCVLENQNLQCAPQTLTLHVPTHIWTSCNSHQHSQSSWLTPLYRSLSWCLWGSAPKTRDLCRSKKWNASRALAQPFRNSWTSTEWLCGSYDRSKTEVNWPWYVGSLRPSEWQGSKLCFHRLLSHQLGQRIHSQDMHATISPQIPCDLEMFSCPTW